MRTRLLAALAVLAAALLAPAAALAAPPAPILSQPTTPTAAASIPLTWIDVAGEDGYHVYRAEADCSGEVDISTVTTVGADQTTFSDLSPAEGTHCYFVRAYDIGGESPDSNHVLVTYDTQPPSGSVTAPAFGSTISTHSQSVPITLRSADAADGDGSGVASVEYFAKPLLGSFASVGAPATSPPYDFAWLPADGTYDLKAIITDNLGHTFEHCCRLGRRRGRHPTRGHIERRHRQREGEGIAATHGGRGGRSDERTVGGVRVPAGLERSLHDDRLARHDCPLRAGLVRHGRAGPGERQLRSACTGDRPRWQLRRGRRHERAGRQHGTDGHAERGVDERRGARVAVTVGDGG